MIKLEMRSSTPREDSLGIATLRHIVTNTLANYTKIKSFIVKDLIIDKEHK
jgi:hypothetical protein